MKMIVHTERGCFSSSDEAAPEKEEMARLHDMMRKAVAGEAGHLMFKTSGGKIWIGEALLKTAVIEIVE